MLCVSFSLVAFVDFVDYVLTASPVDAILSANPLHCPWWQHLRVAFHTKASKSASVLAEPSLKRAVTDTSSVCEFIFVCAFHGTVNWELGEVERGSKLASLTSST